MDCIFSQCLQLNSDVRLPIALGSWFVSDTEAKAYHLTRNSMEWRLRIMSHDELKRQIAKLDSVNAQLQNLLAGDFDPVVEDC